MGPPIDSGKLELGYAFKFYHRNGSENTHGDWANPVVYGRYAINRRLTVSGEGIIGLEYPDESALSDYRGIGVGAGLTAHVFEFEGNQVALSGHYFEILWIDRLQRGRHMDLRSVIASIQVQREFGWHEHEIVLWLAPSYIYDTALLYYPYPSISAAKYDTPNRFGLIIGSEVLLFRHLHPFLHLVYADYVQPRCGVGYRF